MSKQRITLVLCAISLLSLCWIASAQAQVQSGWSEPYRLSSEAGKASEAYLVADQYGYVHSFWTELLFEDERSIIQYARFDGATWSAPNVIYVTGVGIENVSPVVDQQGTLHIVWVEGISGPVYHSHAPAHNALSAQNWAQPSRIDIPAGIIRFQIDSKGIFHVLYINRGEEPGVYYVRSEDQGGTWSEPDWLDPDIPADYTPANLNFQVDEADGLHALWDYALVNPGTPSSYRMRYTHSFDGGNSWSAQVTIARYVEGGEDNPNNAGPRMIVQGQTLHVIWAAGNLPYRHHQFSRDGGQTWSPPRQVFGELHGQAFDSLTVDGAGRVHYFAQIRYPMGIYHAIWNQTEWTSPALVYLIAPEGSEVGIGDRIHAHHTHAVVRAGNQLVLTLADGPADPNRRLFAMQRILNDLAPLAAVPTPVLTVTPMPVSGPTRILPTPIPTATAMAPFADTGAGRPLGNAPNPSLALQVALVPTLLLLVGTVVFRLLRKARS